MRHKAIWMCTAIFVFPALLAAQAQDMDVLGNLTMVDSTATGGNILKGGVPFVHNSGSLQNTFIGRNAGNLTLTGDQNTASGAFALFNNTTGFSNTASGVAALSRNTTGFQNTSSGFNTLVFNTTGSSNTATGVQALQNNSAGGENTASGVNALFGNTTGSANTASGVNALTNNMTGDNNTAIGYAANVSDGALSNATAIGSNAIVNASNKVRLGNDLVTVIEARGDFYASGPGNGIILKSPNGVVCRRLGIDNAGALVTVAVTCP